MLLPIRKYSDTSKRIFTPDELNLYQEFKAVNFQALEDILIRDSSQTKLDLSMIFQHRIIEERQLTHILMDLLQSKVCIVNPNTIVTSNEMFQGKTQPPVCEYFSGQPDQIYSIPLDRCYNIVEASLQRMIVKSIHYTCTCQRHVCSSLYMPMIHANYIFASMQHASADGMFVCL